MLNNIQLELLKKIQKTLKDAGETHEAHLIGSILIEVTPKLPKFPLRDGGGFMVDADGNSLVNAPVFTWLTEQNNRIEAAIKAIAAMDIKGDSWINAKIDNLSSILKGT